VRSYL